MEGSRDASLSPGAGDCLCDFCRFDIETELLSMGMEQALGMVSLRYYTVMYGLGRLEKMPVSIPGFTQSKIKSVLSHDRKGDGAEK